MFAHTCICIYIYNKYIRCIGVDSQPKFMHTHTSITYTNHPPSYLHTYIHIYIMHTGTLVLTVLPSFTQTKTAYVGLGTCCVFGFICTYAYVGLGTCCDTQEMSHCKVSNSMNTELPSFTQTKTVYVCVWESGLLLWLGRHEPLVHVCMYVYMCAKCQTVWIQSFQVLHRRKGHTLV